MNGSVETAMAVKRVDREINKQEKDLKVEFLKK